MTVRPAKTQISLGIRLIWSESSLCAQWVGKDPSFLHAESEDSDQTGRMSRLIWGFAGRTCNFVGFVMRRLICNCLTFLLLHMRWYNLSERISYPYPKHTHTDARKHALAHTVELNRKTKWNKRYFDFFQTEALFKPFEQDSKSSGIVVKACSKLTLKITPPWNKGSLSREHLSRPTAKPTKWHVRPAKTQISLDIRPVWSASSLSAWRKLGSLATHWSYSEDLIILGGFPAWSESSLGAQ